MNEQAQRYPLSWPAGWRRTPNHQRRRANFSRTEHGSYTNAQGQSVPTKKSRALTVADALARLTRELALLGATDEILSTNVITRLDGLPRSGQAEPSDPGAACYFRLKKQPRCLACDRWDRVADNITAIAQHIDALRRIDRYGVGTMEQAFAGYLALPSGKRSWWEVLGFDAPHGLSAEKINDRFRALARERHPDAIGGSEGSFAELSAARDDAIREVQA